MEAASRVTLPFAVLNDNLVAVIAAEVDCEIAALVAVVARDMVPTLSAVWMASVPALLSVMPPVAPIVPVT